MSHIPARPPGAELRCPPLPMVGTPIRPKAPSTGLPPHAVAHWPPLQDTRTRRLTTRTARDEAMRALGVAIGGVLFGVLIFSLPFVFDVLEAVWR